MTTIYGGKPQLNIETYVSKEKQLLGVYFSGRPLELCLKPAKALVIYLAGLISLSVWNENFHPPYLHMNHAHQPARRRTARTRTF